MVFSSIVFLFTFLPISLLIYYILPKKFKNAILLLTSLVFYAWGEPVYIFLMIGTIIFDYIMALKIDKYKKNRKKSKKYFIFTLLVNVGVLVFFKYIGFIIENINSIFSTNISFENLALPVGISFYTFQVLSYIVDVYLGKVKVQRNLISFGAYVTMFPQLVAGPIVQYETIEEQLNYREESLEKFGQGVERFIQGLGKKVLLANNIGMIWTAISAMDLGSMSVLTSWIGIISYTFQIYFDFSGYSDMAIGLGKILGFDFIENFNYPYISKSVTEFWRRWHISLGSWFREYIYIPLGGNRVTLGKQIRNIFAVWFLTGLWHGASWNFIVWGLYYGVILLLEKIVFKKLLEKTPNFIKHIYTMILVMIGWVFFASTNLGYAVEYIKIMFGLGNNVLIDNVGIYYLYTNIVMFVILSICSTPIIKNKLDRMVIKSKTSYINPTLIVYMLILFLATAYLVNETYNPFLYFRF
ncbi:MAG: MBOAT family O-acyltransferase [Intestinibacter sp.]|nr:MBOAT family O-acyltransferase [Intestinibacter sp.]MDY5213564.1 MBOAT family O-acyltransferase [Intestinibacter sp.]